MRTVTVEQIFDFGLFSLSEHVRNLAEPYTEWSAFDLLTLVGVPLDIRLCAVLREELLQPLLLHEFACRRVEAVLNTMDTPDERITQGIRLKRRWMAGEVTANELSIAQDVISKVVRSSADSLILNLPHYVRTMYSAVWVSMDQSAEKAAWGVARDTVLTYAYKAVPAGATQLAWHIAREAAWARHFDALVNLMLENKEWDN